jgi:hypothetical protein
MLLTLVWERAQFAQALPKLVDEQLSNIAAGKVVRLVQFCQVCVKEVPLLTSRRGKEVRLVQDCQACIKLVPLLTSRRGNEARLVQLPQAELKSVTLAV